MSACSPSAVEFDRMVRLLRRARLCDPDNRPRDTTPSACLTREARVELLTCRHRQNLSLWHPGDLVQIPDAADEIGIGVELGRAANGSDYERGVQHG